MNPPAPQLVFGDDGSAAADVVWLWINNHQWPGWRISIVTASKPPLGPPVGRELSTPHPWEPPTPRRLLAGGDDVALEHLMAEADPRLVLDSFNDAALLAIGPRGAGLLKQLGLGSTAEWLISARRPLAPLTVIRSARPTRSVLLCVDGSLHARRATRAMARLPWIAGTHVTVLGVADGSPGIERGVDDAARLLKARGIAEVSTHVARALPQVPTFDVRSTILKTIDVSAPDLVVMGPGGLGGLRRAVLGSTASAVLRHAACSVLISPANQVEAIDAGRPSGSAPGARMAGVRRNLAG
jgi:nucleotide-binding universal stress UspA family protein